METNATINKKACELAADATGCIGTGVAPYVKIRQACIDAIRWQSEQDKLELDAKDERIASVCRYRCGKIGDTYKCAHGKAFGESCTSKNCPILK